MYVNLSDRFMKLSEISKVGIVGAGTMGQGIAISCALANFETILFDVNRDALTAGLNQIQKSLEQSVNKGKLSQQDCDRALTRISLVENISALQANLIIEAVVENLKVKQTLFAQLEKVNDGKAILATNTSSIPVIQIAASLQNPSQCIGLHFFNPAHLMKLVEVISGSQTNPELILLMKDFAKALGKTPVEVKDSPGFIVNRVARHFYVESLKVLEDKVTSFDAIDNLMRSAGFKMGPFELMDLIGIDINYAVTTSVYEGFDKAHKFKPSEIQHQKISEGNLGKKTGKGFYDYSKK
jgi:3-hydroxybutyryl-CoA dehydrogenase